MTKGHNVCCECGGPAPHRMLCAACLPSYGENRLVDDVCQCPTCRSDVAGIVPCEIASVLADAPPVKQSLTSEGEEALSDALGETNTAIEKVAILSNQDWPLARLDMAATLDMIHEIAVSEIYPPARTDDAGQPSGDVAAMREALGRIVRWDQQREWTATAENPETHWVTRDGHCAKIARAALQKGSGR